MSVGRCIERAIDSYKRGDFEDAFIQASIAVASTSEKEYPKERFDNVKYKNFIRENIALITKVVGNVILRKGISLKYSHPKLKKSQDGTYTIEEILYHIVRCCLIHEGGLPPNLSITDENCFKAEGDKSPLVLPATLVFGMVVAVAVSPENAVETISPNYRIHIEGQDRSLSDLLGKKHSLEQELGL